METSTPEKRRYCDTELLTYPWFWPLSPESKNLWIFIWDTCDDLGYWKIDIPKAGKLINRPITRDHVRELERTGHLVVYPNLVGWIPEFYPFQNGD